MSRKYTTIEVKRNGEVVQVTMSRPEVHNAFNEHLIADCTHAYEAIASEADGDAPPRVVVFTGEGKSFSAGADLKWMGKMKAFSFQENMEDSLALAELMYLIYT